jgi:hypothetical protein
MAGIDYTIPAQIRPIQVESPMNAMARAMQLRNLQESSQMNALRMQEQALKTQETQETSRQRNALAAYLANPQKPTDPLELEAGVRKVAPLLADQFVDTQLKREELGVRTAERQVKTEELGLKREERKRAMSKEQFFEAVSDLTSYEKVSDVLSGLQQKLDAGQITEEQKNQVVAGLPDNDAEIPAWQVRTMRRLLTPEQKIADLRAEKKDTREAARLELEDARVQETQRHALAMESIGRAGADRAQLQLEETTRHNKAMERLRAREINKPPAGENPNKVASTTTDDNGNVTFYNAFGQVIRTEANAGKRSPNVIKAEQAEKNLGRDIERATKELADITKDGGLIDKSTGSGVGRIADIGARFVGTALEGDIASGKLKPIADMVLKMVPRFEGPQSDKDTQSYKEAAGQLADSSLPREIRKEAGKTILRLMKERKDQFAGEGMDTSPNQRRAAPPPPSGFVPDNK